MKSNYKKFFLWSSLGSIAIGAAVALSLRSRPVPHPALAYRKIPRNCKGVLLWTERFEIEENGGKAFAYDRYTLIPTNFQVWSVLDLSPQSAPGRGGPEGAEIFHITHVRIGEPRTADAGSEEERLLDRFYGVVTVVDAAGRSAGNNAIARGGTLEIKKCYVGGSSNGVESGEAHSSLAPVLNYRIESGNLAEPPQL